jgi:hypothetical protein
MILPIIPQFWRPFAQGCAAVFIGFAMVASRRHCFRAGSRQSSHDLRSLRCYPSPSLRSGPSQAGPILMSGCVAADCGTSSRNCFQNRDIAVESAAITTNSRGRIQCGSRLSSSLFLSYRCPVVCRTQRPAVPLVRPQAPLLRMRPTATCLPVRSSAGLRVLQPAVSNLACRPAIRATDSTACGRREPTRRTIRASCPGGPFPLRLRGDADV